MTNAVMSNFPIFIILILQFHKFNDNSRNNYKLDLLIAKVFMNSNNNINVLFYLFLDRNFKNVFIVRRKHLKILIVSITICVKHTITFCIV